MKLNLSRSITYFFNIKNKFNDNNYQIVQGGDFLSTDEKGVPHR